MKHLTAAVCLGLVCAGILGAQISNTSETAQQAIIGVTVPGVPADYQGLRSGDPAGDADAGTPVSRPPSHDLGRLARRFADQVALLLRLAGDRPVRRLDFLVPEADLASALTYYREHSVTRALSGFLEQADDGTLSLTLTVWNAASDDTSSRSLRAQRSLVDATLVEEAARLAAGQVLGEDLRTGELVVEGAGQLDAFAVFANGNLLGRNEARFRLPPGEYELTVAVPGVLGDQPVLVETRSVRAGAQTTVSVEQSAESSGDDGATQGQADESVERGALVVESSPAGALVFLDGREIGMTPFSRLGVPVGRYELALEAEGFAPRVALAEVRPEEQTAIAAELEVDTDHPRVAALLRAPALGSVAGVAGLAVKVASVALGFIGGDEYGVLISGRSTLYMLDLAVLAASMPAHSLAGATVRAGALSLSSVIGAGAILSGAAVQQNAAARDWWYSVMPLGPVDLGAAVAAIFTGGAQLYDMIVGPQMIERSNERTLEDVRASGTIPEPASAPRRTFAVEVLGGSVARALYVHELVRPWLRAEAGAGAHLTSVDPLRAGAHGVGRIVVRTPGWTPWTLNTGVFGEVVTETDFVSFGAALGVGLSTWSNLGPVELYWRHSLRSPVTRWDPVVLIGVGVAL